MKGYPPPAASEATLPPLGALQAQREADKSVAICGRKRKGITKYGERAKAGEAR